MFRKLLTLDEARQVIHEHFEPKPLGVEEISLTEAHNRILAEDVTASLDIPPFNRSTVDGYAVKAEDTFGAEENKPAALKIIGAISAGELPKIAIEKHEAAEIVTGAPMPDGADAVVMVEDTEKTDNELHVYAAVTKGENVMKAGSDIRKGEIILRRGQSLGSREIGVLAAVGIAKATVYRVPRVAILSTGAEVTEPGKQLPPGKIYDINAHSLSAAVAESGGKPVYLGVIPDDKTALEQTLQHALVSADLVLTSGGVSVGPKDIVPKTLDALGKPGVIVSGIAIKPGKPVTIGLVGEKLVFSLPGHPASALLVFHLLVRPLIQQMSGAESKQGFTVKALAATRMFPAKGRRTFIMVRMKKNGANRLVAEPVATGISGAITTLSKADGFVEITENQQFIDADEEVTVHLFGYPESDWC